MKSRRKTVFTKIEFNEAIFKSEEINKKFKIHTDEDINYYNKKDNIKNAFGIELKSTEIYKKNISKKKERMDYLLKLKNKIKRKLSFLYGDSRLNYNKMVINNILSNKASRIKVMYTEMLNEIETIDLFSRYIYRRDVYYFLKYLLVVYDKFQMQYPNYLNDINVNNFMSKYLLIKQKFIDRACDSNYHTYIHENLKKLFSNDISLSSRFFQSKMSNNDSEEENYVKIHQIRDQGFEVDDENSQDFLDKLQNLAVKIGKNTEKKEKRKEYKRIKSKSIKTIDTFLAKYINGERNMKVKLTNLYSINNKKFQRSQKRKKTEIVLDKKIVNMVRTHMNNSSKKNRKRKMTRRQNLTEMKKLVLLNDIGKNSRVLDIMKRGYLFINDDKKIKNNNAQKNFIKIKTIKGSNFKENKKEKPTSISIKKIESKITNFNYSNDFYNGENFPLSKNIKNIFKSLNENLNNYQFYNKIPFNSSEKQKFYDRKVKPGIFNTNSNLILNFRKDSLKNEKKKEFPSIGTNTSSRKTYYTNTEPRCKKLEKLNKNVIYKKMKKNRLILPIYINKKKSKYNIYSIKTDIDEENPRLFRNQIERIKNNIYNFYRAKNTKNKKGFQSTLNDFNKMNSIDFNNSKDAMNKNIKINNLFITNSDKNRIISKRKFEFFVKNDKKIFNNTSYNPNYNENNEVNKQNAFSIKNTKNTNKNELSHISFNSSKYNFRLINEMKNKYKYIDILKLKNNKTVIKIKH